MLRVPVSRARLAILCLASTVACRQPAPASPPAPPLPATAVFEATLENGFLTVDVRVPATPAGPKPAVISHLGDPEPILAAGAVLVTYRINWDVLKGFAPREPPRNTVGAWLLAAPTAKTVGRAWFGLIAASAERVPRVIDYLATVPDVDPYRIAIAGSSTSGFVALEATAREPRLAAAVAIAACGDYRDFLHRSSLAMNGDPLDLDAAYARELAGRQAISHPERLTHAAVLMVNGVADLAVPITCARATARVLEQAYARAGAAERFRLVAVEGAGHSDLAAQARSELLAWLGRWIGLGAARTAGTPAPAPRA